MEEQQTYASKAIGAQAAYRQAAANLEQARVNLKRTRIHSPLNGYVTNLLARTGDYASVGRNVLSIVDVDSFWVDAYFEETSLRAIEEGAPVRVKLMGYTEEIQGHVGSVARGIDVANARAGQRPSLRSIPFSLGCALPSACRYHGDRPRSCRDTVGPGNDSDRRSASARVVEGFTSINSEGALNRSTLRS